jgi:hypothetical protein
MNTATKYFLKRSFQKAISVFIPEHCKGVPVAFLNIKLGVMFEN